MKNILAICAVVATAGCASRGPSIDDLTPAQRARVMAMQMNPELGNRAYSVVGHVDGTACARDANQPQDESKDHALQGAMVQAVLLGADALTNTYCIRSLDADLMSFCGAPVKCGGDAIKYQN